jgi:uncharacterized protein (UPF0248 family)
MKILNSLRNKDSFRLARRAFKYFCSQRGIYGAKFGFLGGFAVTLLIAAMCHYLPEHASASQIVAAVIKRYSEFPWESKVLFFPTGEKGRGNREERDAMYVCSIHRPLYNVTKNASQSTLRAIVLELKKASANMSTSFAAISGNGLNDFMQLHPKFVKIHCLFWGVSPSEGRKWISWIESRLVMLLVSLSKSCPQLETRLWPSRFGDIGSEDIHGIYLIGVSGDVINENALVTVLTEAEKSMRLNGEDATDRWVTVTLCTGREVASEALQVDTRVWEGEEEIINEEEIEEEEQELQGPQPYVPLLEQSTKGKGGKLRTSQDIFNRLFWDPAYSTENYAIGYEDRFKGIMEISLTSWRKEFTEEDFIPFHRVVYFREKGKEGKIVWDRRTRLDLIFGSGS